MKIISVETLRDWLEEQRPMTILDVRPTSDYQEWAIPGSTHLDAYEALKAGDTTPLEQVVLPKQIPVITVCGAGKTSLLAAVGDITPPSYRASAVGVYHFWRDSGYAIGALLSGIVADLLGFGWALAVVGGLTFISGLVAALWMQETHPS